MKIVREEGTNGIVNICATSTLSWAASVSDVDLEVILYTAKMARFLSPSRL